MNDMNDAVMDYANERQNQAGTTTDFKINIKLINKSNNPNPSFETDGASGFDLRASLLPEEIFTIPSGQFGVVPTGLYFGLTQGMEIQVRPRSGLAAKYGVTVLNTPGTIDSDYRGEVKIILINHGIKDFQIVNGDRIAQGVIGTVIGRTVMQFSNVDYFEQETGRGTGGFGHTGLK